MDNIYRKFNSDFIKLCGENGEADMIIYDTGYKIKRYTYENLFSYCKKYAAFFREKGLKKGDCIVTILPNSPEAAICFFSALLCGIHYAPLPCTVTKREFYNWIKLVDPGLILKKEGIADFETGIPSISCSCDGDLRWLGEMGSCIEENFSPNIYLLTSGTTGLPKAMSINADKLWSSGNRFVQCYQIEKSQLRFWNYLPMSYLGGLFNLAMIPLCCRGSFVISEPFSGKMVLNFWTYIKKHNISALWLVPSIIQGLLRLSKLVGGIETKEICDRIKTCFLGTAPISLKQKQEFESVFGLRLFENFALSETTFLTGEREDNIRFREQGSVGEKLPYVEIRLLPIEGVDDTYSIWVKTPYLFNGYLSSDGNVDLEVDGEGFFDTKDLGRINDDNVLVLQGRNRDIIKKGGLFVSLNEIEHVIQKLPNVAEVAAVPFEHDFYGESYYLCVILEDQTKEKDDIEYIHLWMLENFVPYKHPERIISLKEFPRTVSGKIQKKEILKILEEEKHEYSKVSDQ